MNPHQRCLQAKVKYRNEPKHVMLKSEDLSRSRETNAIWICISIPDEDSSPKKALSGASKLISTFFFSLSNRSVHVLYTEIRHAEAKMLLGVLKLLTPEQSSLYTHKSVYEFEACRYKKALH